MKRKMQRKEIQTRRSSRFFHPWQVLSGLFFLLFPVSVFRLGFSRFLHRIFSGIAFQLIGHMNKDNKKPSTLDSSCFQHLHNFIVKSPS